MNVDAIYHDCLAYNEYKTQQADKALLFNMIQSGLDAYENAVTLLTCSNQDLTAIEHMFACENLMDAAKNAIQQFIAWLKNILKKMLSWLMRTYQLIKVKLTAMFSTSDPNGEIYLKQNLNKIESTLGKIHNNPIKTRLITEQDVLHDIEDITAQLKRLLSDEDDEFVYTRARVKAHAELVQEYLHVRLDSLDKCTSILTSFRQDIDRFTSLTENNRKEFESVCVTNLIDFGKTIAPILHGVGCNIQDITSVKEYVNFLFTVIDRVYDQLNILADHLKNLHLIYSGSKIHIHMMFPFDSGTRNRLESYFGGPLNLGVVVVTNVSPSAWANPVDETISTVGGWCYTDNTLKGYNLWINATYLLSWIARWTYAFVSNYNTSKEDWFIHTIVHECKHLWDSQHDLPFDSNKSGVAYPDRVQESRARNAANKYVIANADRAWAKKIIQAVEAEYKKQTFK